MVLLCPNLIILWLKINGAFSTLEWKGGMCLKGHKGTVVVLNVLEDVHVPLNLDNFWVIQITNLLIHV